MRNLVLLLTNGALTLLGTAAICWFLSPVINAPRSAGAFALVSDLRSTVAAILAFVLCAWLFARFLHNTSNARWLLKSPTAP